ncbi:2-hydroxycarboxylate transporter family protein [Pseudomonas sp. JUb96]|uniref:2-hydroxycarboxylate transporter family protein n=1 Tax=Pseudomonas sp. JUb96 TaxID=2940539 RepID=UPI002226AAEE|nr:2-hydroxycarboxylate transporter family protein [Pseudomonas sp. JUb96]MCW2271827.1 Na+/citrate or Na+/malate symporter [Pseudomonas sp. JUb96]
MDIRIGFVPLPILVMLSVVLTLTASRSELSSQLSPMIALLGICSCVCFEIGNRIPLLRSIGGPVIMAMFLPSYLVFAKILPESVVIPIVTFWKATNFLYLFIPCIIVGSILSMDRTILLAGFFRLFVPLAAGSIAAGLVGTAVGVALGMDVFHTVFFVVVPVMSGGLGEGVIPLTVGYSSILGRPYGDLLAHAMPAVMMGNVCAIVFSALLNTAGKRWPQYTGNGVLMKSAASNLEPGSAEAQSYSFDVKHVAAAGMVAVCLYAIGMYAEHAFGLPGPVVMLLLAVLGKVAFVFSPSIEQGAGTVYRFFATAVTYPLLFAIGIVVTPWQKVQDAFNFPTVMTIVATVATLMTVAFFVGRKVNMHPIDAAIVVGTHSGMGGTGDVAILTASNRMQLMPFAQIATRIGGAITISGALLVLSWMY